MTKDTRPKVSAPEDEGALVDEAPAGQWAAWALRKRLPSELAQQPMLGWPGDVSSVLGGKPSPQSLERRRAEGDCPRLYGVGTALFTTIDDVRDWLMAHELAPGHLLRPATFPKGTRRGPKVAKGERRPRPRHHASVKTPPASSEVAV